VTGVIAKRYGRAVGRAYAALCAEDQELLLPQLIGAPSHRGVLCPAEDIPTGGVAQPIGLQGQAPRGSRGVGLHIV
jgi:hypothetical protein